VLRYIRSVVNPVSFSDHVLFSVHYDGPGNQLPGTTAGGYGWDVRTKNLSSKLEAEEGQDQGGEGGQPTSAVAP